jgi:Zn-dependent protease with chaperone function
VDVVETPARLLHCHGAWRPGLVASRGVVDGLPRDQLRTAVVHEVAHIVRHDVLRGWGLLALRLAQWFNPVAQLFGRRATQEMEWEADRVAATVTGAPLGLARALIWSVRGRDAQFLGVLGRGRAGVIEERCRRLLDYDPDIDAVAPHVAPAVAGLVAGLATLLFFVT